MRHRVEEEQRAQLLEQPETGMGFQLVPGEEVTWLILNASVAIPLEHGEMSVDDRDWLLSEYALLPEDRVLYDRWTIYAPDLFWAREREERALIDLPPYKGNIQVQQHGSYRSMTKHGEGFVRYSAFWPDRRIEQDGSVLGGTYATTVTDRPMVPSGLAAVARYALPNPIPATFEYRIAPPTGRPVHCGTCIPKHGQAGGGVEIRFDTGLPSGSAFGPTVISER